jgi:GTP-binding protein HflX
MSDNWNVGKQKTKGIKQEVEYAVLVAVSSKSQTKEQSKEYIDELEFLAETAGAKTKKIFIQNLEHPDKRTYVGKGKLEEIILYVQENEEINMVIFDDDLTGKQTSILEEELTVKIIDRSSLILDIFAKRAQTAQARTQVELAQMQYMLPRLRGLWTHLERQRGGIGMRGPGEMEIETDRRIVRDKISHLKTKLEKIDRQSQTQRKNRGDMIRVALVGYTNVGKSTLMNTLSKSEVFAENKLFATLDTTVRKVVLNRMPFLLSDTVGFIRKLPHHLVESFKSTLDEAKESDLILHVVDMSHPTFEDQIATVNQTLKDLDAFDKPTLMILNKVDAYRKKYFDDFLDQENKDEILKTLKERLQNEYGIENIIISAKSKENIDVLKANLQEKIATLYKDRYPYIAKSW